MYMNVGSEICMYYLYIVVLWILYGTFAYFYQWLQELMGERDKYGSMERIYFPVSSVSVV
jgi:hypothetical protein